MQNFKHPLGSDQADGQQKLLWLKQRFKKTFNIDPDEKPEAFAETMAFRFVAYESEINELKKSIVELSTKDLSAALFLAELKMGVTGCKEVEVKL